MARHPDEGAVAQSARSYFGLTPGRQLPWSSDVLEEDLDAIAAERLPAHVLERGCAEREEAAAGRREAKENEAWYESQLAGLEG